MIFLTEMKEGDTRFSFDYNEEGQVIKINLNTDGQNAQSIIGNVIYENGKPSEVLFKNQPDQDLTFKFVYDEKGNIVESIIPLMKDTVWFTYDNEGRMISYAFKTPASKIYERWTYDQNGNVKMEDTHTYQYWENTGNIYADNYFKSTYEYDDKRNPLSYNNVGKLFAVIRISDETNLERILSYNNPKSKVHQYLHTPRDPMNGEKPATTTYTDTYTNTYDANGYLTKTVKHYKTERYIGTELQESPNGEGDHPEIQYTLVKKRIN